MDWDSLTSAVGAMAFDISVDRRFLEEGRVPAGIVMGFVRGLDRDSLTSADDPLVFAARMDRCFLEEVEAPAVLGLAFVVGLDRGFRATRPCGCWFTVFCWVEVFIEFFLC